MHRMCCKIPCFANSQIAQLFWYFAAVCQVWGTPSVLSFLTDNQPWSTYISNDNFKLQQLQPGTAVQLSDAISVTAVAVPHRAEFSDAVGFYVQVGHRHRPLTMAGSIVHVRRQPPHIQNTSM